MQKESRLPFTSTRERQKENDRNPVQNAAEISRSGPHGGENGLEIDYRAQRK